MKKSILLALVFCTFGVNAQETEEAKKEKFSISGGIDTYYRTNFNAPNGDNAVAPATSFSNLPGFALGMANLIVGYEDEKVGFVADLVYGPRGEDATFMSGELRPDGSSNIVNQLYTYWNVSDNVTLTFGNFNTFLGYEVISPTGNFNYSTSYLFSYGPFSHTGLKADIALGENTSLMLAVMNPTDATEYNPNSGYAIGGQFGFYGQYLNVLVDQGAFEIDYTGGFDITEKFYLGINGAYYNSGKDNGDVGFGGVALYPQYTTSELFTIGLRTEYFQEVNAFGAIGTEVKDSSVIAATLTGNFRINDLTIIPELRLDSSSDDFFLDSDLEAQKSLSSFALAAVYSF